jgi:hypothetical protein
MSEPTLGAKPRRRQRVVFGGAALAVAAAVLGLAAEPASAQPRETICGNARVAYDSYDQKAGTDHQNMDSYAYLMLNGPTAQFDYYVEQLRYWSDQYVSDSDRRDEQHAILQNNDC